MIDLINLPKADLHCHLLGSLTKDDLFTIMKENEKENEFVLEDNILFESDFNFFDTNVWSLISKIVSSPSSIAKAVEIVLRKHAHDGVNYSEIIINFGKMIDKGLSMYKTTELLEDTLQIAKKRFGTDAMIRLGVNRNDGPNRLVEMKNLLSQFRNSCYIGIDLNGDEKKFPTSFFISELRNILDKKINLSVHFGEENSRLIAIDDVFTIKPLRIGHGLSLAYDTNTINYLIKNDIVLEICLSSNLSTKVVDKLSEHPVLIFEQYKIPYVLATDDMAFFNTTLSNEYQLLRSIGISDKRIEEIANLSLSFKNRKAYLEFS